MKKKPEIKKETILGKLLEQHRGDVCACFRVQNALADHLTKREELALRAEYAGIPVAVAWVYMHVRKVLRYIKHAPQRNALRGDLADVIKNDMNN